MLSKHFVLFLTFCKKYRTLGTLFLLCRLGFAAPAALPLRDGALKVRLLEPNKVLGKARGDPKFWSSNGRGIERKQTLGLGDSCEAGVRQGFMTI